MFSKVAFLLVVGITCVWGHARLMDPPARSTLWRFPDEFGWANPEPNYQDAEIWCDNVRQLEVDTRCGVCGDGIERPVPRDNERGGRYGRNVIARNYTAGQTIPIKYEIEATHGGYFMIQLCSAATESESCFQTLTLGNGRDRWPMGLGDPSEMISTTAQLPPGVTCDLCTIRVHWRGAQNWGDCDDSSTCECDGGQGGHGCGLQQTFRSCADITIH